MIHSKRFSTVLASKPFSAIASFLSKERLLQFEIPITISVLFFLSFLSYGLLIPWLGFYWDDWLFVWVGRAQGASSLIYQMSWDRPASGVLYMLTYSLAQDNLLLWHIFSFSLHFLSSVLVLWALRRLWPEQRFGTMTIALLFTIYPGFLGAPHGQIYLAQYVHLSLGAFSLGATIHAQQAQSRRSFTLWTLLAVVCGVVNLLLYEIMVAVEILRLLVLYYMSWRQDRRPLRDQIIPIAGQWWPYVLGIAAFVIWRLFFFTPIRTDVDVSVILDKYRQQPFTQLSRITFETMGDFIESTLLAWFVPLQTQLWRAAPNTFVVSFLLGVSAFFLVFWLCRLLKNDDSSAESSGRLGSGKWYKAAIVMGVVTTFVGLIPPVLADHDYKIATLWDRLSIPVMIAIAMLVAGVIFAILTPRARHWIIAGLAGIAVVTHVNNANLFRNVWQGELNLWWQMSWRVPALEPETVLVIGVPEESIYPREEYTYEVWSPANMIYAPEAHDPVIYGTRLSEGVALKMLSGEPMTYSVLSGISFEMDFDNALVILAPTESSCLRIIDGTRVELPQYTHSLARFAAGYSHIDRIQTDGTHIAPPRQIFGNEPAHTWCYYFERADLARQTGDWQQVVQLGDEARERGFSPEDETEWLPFIEGYAELGRCTEAQQLANLVQEAVPALPTDMLSTCQ